MEKLPKARNEMDVPKTEEKKLTNEATIDSLKEMAVKFSKDTYVNRILVNAIHFIQDLQAENEQLKCDTYKTSWKGKFLKAKKEIERLTEEGEARESDLKIAWVDMEDSRQKYHKCYREKEELRKQVDELTAFKNEAISMSLYGKWRKDGEEVAIKNTAKEICDLILEYWENKQFVECDWLRVAISERYGVEVE